MENEICLCQECQKKHPRNEMTFSKDCHGIPFRFMCFECWNKILDSKGYDGEYYTEFDEQIEEDY